VRLSVLPPSAKLAAVNRRSPAQVRQSTRSLLPQSATLAFSLSFPHCFISAARVAHSMRLNEDRVA